MFCLLSSLLLTVAYVTSREALFRMPTYCENRTILDDYVVKRVTVSNWIDCARECSEMYTCISFTMLDKVCKISAIWMNETCSPAYTETLSGASIYSYKEKKCLNGGYLADGICWCGGGYAGDSCQIVVQDCTEAGEYPYYTKTDVWLNIKPKLATTSFSVRCINRGPIGRTVMMARARTDVTFNLDWNSYREGFRYGGSDIWMGLEHVHALTESRRPYTLIVMVGGVNYGTISFVQTYYNFTVSGEDSKYTMDYTSTESYPDNPLGDSFSRNKGMPFSTFDKDSTPQNCTNEFQSAWWFSIEETGSCSHCNPTGMPGRSPNYTRLGTNTEIFFDYDLGDWAPYLVQMTLVYSP